MMMLMCGCVAGEGWCEDGDDPGQQPADSSRQASAHHWRGHEMSGGCQDSIVTCLSPVFPRPIVGEHERKYGADHYHFS